MIDNPQYLEKQKRCLFWVFKTKSELLQTKHKSEEETRKPRRSDVEDAARGYERLHPREDHPQLKTN